MAASTSLVAVEVKPHKIPNVTEIIPPVDFSFLHLTSLADCGNEEPREHKHLKVKISSEGGGKKYLSHCLRLNNNKLGNINNLMSLAVSLFVNAASIEWIDLSFNILTSIDPILTQFENLKILYLHGNNISELKEVHKLAHLKKLWKLTLHGNEIEKIKGYRYYVLSSVKTLKNFDFSRVTKGDIVTANTWTAFTNADKPKRVAQY